MIPMDIPMNAALNAGTAASTPVQPAAAAAAPSTSKLPGKAGAGGCKSSSFHDELREVHHQMQAAEKGLHPDSPAGKSRTEDTVPAQAAVDNIPEEQDLQADDTPASPESKSDIKDLCSFLLQILQQISTGLQSAESVSEPGADATGAELPEDDTAKTLSQLLDILKQLQDAPQDVVPSPAAAARLSELCDQLKSLADAAPSAALPGQIHQMLQDLHEHLSGLAWGRMMKAIRADQPATAPGAEKEPLPAVAATEVGADAPRAVQNPPEDGLQVNGRNFRAEPGPVERDVKPAATESREVSTPGTASEDAQPSGVEREPLARVPASPAAPANHAGEGGRASEPARSAAATGDPSGPLGGVREDQHQTADGERQPAGDRLITKTVAGTDGPASERKEPAVPFEMDTAGQRPLQLQAGGSEKAPDAAGVGKEKEAAGAGRPGIFDQIVQRAVVQVKTGQSEIKIDLKPDFLGNVRMQIVSENQQVSVRILTELPAVRDMIETGLQQLRSELQNQGLHVDRLEVAVSDDPRQSPRRQARPDELPKPWGVGDVSGTEGPAAAGRSDSVYYPRRAVSAATIDMFV
jgi:flagellar hook-length control protein FliK